MKVSVQVVTRVQDNGGLWAGRVRALVERQFDRLFEAGERE